MIVTVASGKGGVGKSNFVANLGLALTEFGVDTVIVDGNLTNGDLSCILGPPFPKRTLHDVINKNKAVSEAIFEHPVGVKAITASLAVEDVSASDPTSLSYLAEELNSLSDVVLVDSPGTLGPNTVESIKMADKVILITTPEITSYSNTLKTRKIAEKEGVDVLGAVVNKARRNFDKISKESEEWLGVSTLAIIPYDENVMDAVESGRPVLKSSPYSDFSVKLKEFAANLANVEYKAPNMLRRMVGAMFKY